MQDYHVIFMYHPEPEKCLVYDLDSELPFPTYVHKYVTETFRTDHILKSDYFRLVCNNFLGIQSFFKFTFRYFRVIAASDFLRDFASDRRHMKRPDGSWIKPPPNYPAITTTSMCSSIFFNILCIFVIILQQTHIILRITYKWNQIKDQDRCWIYHSSCNVFTSQQHSLASSHHPKGGKLSQFFLVLFFRI